MAPPPPNFLQSLLVPALLSSLFANKSRFFFFSKRRTFLNLKFPDPGSKRGFWHTALEDWDHGHHSQSHGVCALQVSAGVFNVHCTKNLWWRWSQLGLCLWCFWNDRGAVDNLEKGVCDVWWCKGYLGCWWLWLLYLSHALCVCQVFCSVWRCC